MAPKDHYVPRLYLEGFVDPRTDKLWVIDLKASSLRPDAPINAARISGYDNLRGNTTTPKDRLIARKALQALETRAAPVLVKLRNQFFQLSFDNKWHLSNFIGQQISRVPNFRKAIDSRMDQVPHEILRKEVLSDKFESKYGKDSIIKQRVLHGEYPQVRLNFRGPYDREDGVLLSSIILGDKLSSFLLGMNWIFLVTRDNEPFLTSDNPARLSSPNLDFNKPDRNIEVAFPISPSCVLLAHYHSESQYRHTHTFIDPFTVSEMNSGMFRTASRYIYCSKKEQANQILNEIHKPPA